MKSKIKATTRSDGTRWFGHLRISTRAEIPPPGPDDTPGPLSETDFQNLEFENLLDGAEGLPRYQRYLRRHRR